MLRYNRLLELTTHPMHKKLWSKLSLRERSMVEEFVKQNESLSTDEYAFKCNRWLLDKEKPKNYSAMWALVFQSK